MIDCPQCGLTYDPVATRWLCVGCGYKDSCCEGEPQCLNGDAPSAGHPVLGRETISTPTICGITHETTDATSICGDGEEPSGVPV